MRRDLLTYFGLPFYRAMLERSGFGEDIAAYDEAAARGDGEAMQAAISERFLRRAVRDRLARGRPRRRGALSGRRRQRSVRRADRKDRLRGHAARGRAGLAAAAVDPRACGAARR